MFASQHPYYEHHPQQQQRQPQQPQLASFVNCQQQYQQQQQQQLSPQQQQQQQQQHFTYNNNNNNLYQYNLNDSCTDDDDTAMRDDDDDDDDLKLTSDDQVEEIEIEIDSSSNSNSSSSNSSSNSRALIPYKLGTRAFVQNILCQLCQLDDNSMHRERVMNWLRKCKIPKSWLKMTHFEDAAAAATATAAGSAAESSHANVMDDTGTIYTLPYRDNVQKFQSASSSSSCNSSGSSGSGGVLIEELDENDMELESAAENSNLLASSCKYTVEDQQHEPAEIAKSSLSVSSVADAPRKRHSKRALQLDDDDALALELDLSSMNENGALEALARDLSRQVNLRPAAKRRKTTRQG